MKSARNHPQSTTTQHREHRFVLLIVFGMFLMFVLIGLSFFVMSMGKAFDSAELTLESQSGKNAFIYPTSKDILIKGKTYTLLWEGGPPTIEQLDLVNRAYEKEGVSVSLVDRFYNLENTGSYKVTIPTEIPDGQYKFQIGPMASEYFIIVEK